MRSDCHACAIRGTALCGALPDGVLQQMSRVSWRTRLPEGAVIRASSNVVRLVSGVVRLSKSLPDGRQQIVSLVFPSSIIGQPLVDTESVLVEAATPVDLCLMPRSQFDTLIAEHVEARRFLLDRASAELDAAREWMLLLGRMTAEERVASLLLKFVDSQLTCANEGGATGAAAMIELPLSRTEMALYLGLTLETVGRMMKRLQHAGAIEPVQLRLIRVPDVAALRAHVPTARH
jgi:CRP/FNR family transcriptional regulator, anaerobic regulatory protein